MKKSKVVIGPVDIANICLSLKKALESSGIQCDYYSFWNSNNTYSYKKDKTIFQFFKTIRIFNKNPTVIINHILRFIFFPYLLLRYNTFIFIFPNTYLLNNVDLILLKLFNKKVVTFLLGCPDRKVDLYPNDPEYICNRCNDDNKKSLCLCNQTNKKEKRVQRFEKFSQYLVSQNDSAGYLLNKPFIWAYVISDKPGKKNYLEKYKSEDIVISHFPSNPLIKLSHIIIPVLERIASENPFIKLQIESNIMHADVLRKLEDTHILVDALGLSYGVLGVEAMFRGCVVVAGQTIFMDETMKDHPIVSVTTNNLYKKIIDLIENRDSLLLLAQKSIEFADKYHSYNAAGEYYKYELQLS